MRRWIPMVAASAGLFFCAGEVKADAGPKIAPGWYLPVGIPLGVSINHGDASFLLGAEASFVHIDRGLTWLGVYADVVRDWGMDSARVSVGPELGVGPLGIDGGYLMEFRDGERADGFVIRPMFTLGFMALYGRVGHVLDDRTFGEVGLLLKAPIEVDTEPYRHGPPPGLVPLEPEVVAPEQPAEDEPAREPGTEGRFAEPPPDSP